MLYKKSLQVLTLMVIMWMVSLFTIVTHYRTMPVRVLTPMQAYEENLKVLEHNVKRNMRLKMTSFSDDDYDLHSFQKLSLKDKLKALKSDDFPPGMEGKPVYLQHNLKNPLRQYVKKGWSDHAFNEFVSSTIPLNRTLPDVRDPWCKEQNYSNDLPKASVVICFHNEAWSTLLRTVHSVLDRSPPDLLKEIILFDDYSDMNHLRRPLDVHIAHLDKVYIKRSQKRVGLIKARILATKAVTASVVIFLDSHCECTEGWLEPLLKEIATNKTKVVSPVVDIIHDNTFEYIHQDTHDLQIGGFTWNLKFTWQPIPRRKLIERKHPAEPIQTPTISGGLFAIDLTFFKHLGYYDKQFKFWGGENLELSFKTWMCGGSLEIVPCSHVGHVFRKRFPYRNQPGATRRNCVRLAEVWMDDYSKYFYQRIGYDIGDFGDISQLKNLRKSLQCKTFDWYLKEVYPEMEIPDSFVASGRIQGLSGDSLCFDANSNVQFDFRLKLLPCHFKGENQYWVYTKDGEIKKDRMCLEDVLNNVVLNFCTGHRLSQVWLYNNEAIYKLSGALIMYVAVLKEMTRHFHTKTTQTIINKNSLKCITAGPHDSGWIAVTQTCSGAHRQTWLMENYNASHLSPEVMKQFKDGTNHTDIN